MRMVDKVTVKVTATKEAMSIRKGTFPLFFSLLITLIAMDTLVAIASSPSLSISFMLEVTGSWE